MLILPPAGRRTPATTAGHHAAAEKLFQRTQKDFPPFDLSDPLRHSPPRAPLHHRTATTSTETTAATAAAITTATSSSSPHTASPTADTHKILSTTTATRLPRSCPTATAVHH
uniref:Uncharacterized protein n=1 Tax=Tanacetum cinerariifolium TaxID=118510 RepID=A0A6L2NSX8_TANCI|nr:hypothetical protein [Tanacetum cinerariifolium]